MFTSRDRSPATTEDRHDVLDASLLGGWPEQTQVLYLGMGCFWGTERIFWQLPGVVSTAVGYMGGHVEQPTYEQVCSGRTGHAEAVLVAYDPARVTPDELLKAFWENHDPTTLNRQGNDVGTQYRSAIYWTTEEQREAAQKTQDLFQSALDANDRGRITTEIKSADEVGRFWPAERYHQQYLDKHPGGYCNHGFKGVTCPVGVANLPAQQEILPPN